MNLKITLTLIFLSLSITQCLASNLWVQYTPLNNMSCTEKSKEFYLFFDNETNYFEYQKLGLVEIETSSNYSTRIILAYLQEAAWKNCANGLINVRESNYSKSEWSNRLDTYITVHYIKYTAVAVRINADQQFQSKYGNQSNMDFLDYLTAYRQVRKKYQSAKRKVDPIV